ncbi:MAG: STAS domain-containing protein [Anaerolineae bacterium]
MEPKLTINVRRVAEGAAALEVHGELTRLADAPLAAAYAEATALGARTIILDLSGLSYMNNKGMGLLVRLEAQARREGRRLVAAGLSDHYRRVFRMTGLDEGIPVFDDVSQAVAAQ